MKSATKTKKAKNAEPLVINGSHSTRIEYPDGRVEFTTHWDALVRDVKNALLDYELSQVRPIIKAKAIRKRKLKE